MLPYGNIMLPEINMRLSADTASGYPLPTRARAEAVLPIVNMAPAACQVSSPQGCWSSGHR